MYMRRFLVSFVLFFGFSTSYALFDFQFMGGYQSVPFKGFAKEPTPVKGASASIGLHLSPVPLVPVALGLVVSAHSFQLDKDHHRMKALGGFLAGFEVTGWLNFGDFQPYAKVGKDFGLYTGTLADNFFADGRIPNASNDTLFLPLTVSGFYLGTGLKWSFFPLFSVVFDYQINFHDIKSGLTVPEEIKSQFVKQDFNNVIYSIGLEVGL